MSDDTELENNLKAILERLISASSTCWHEQPTGKFDTDKATMLFKEATNKIMLLINNRDENEKQTHRLV